MKEMLQSRKFIAMIAGLIVQIGGKLGLQLDEETIDWCTGLIIAYIVGQSIADHGVAPAKIASATTTVKVEEQTPTGMSSVEKKEVQS